MKPTRRDAIALVALGGATHLACKGRSKKSGGGSASQGEAASAVPKVPAAPKTVVEAIAIVLAALGPWDNAGDFAQRFAANKRRAKVYGESEADLLSVATKLQGADSIDTKELPEGEREVLIKLLTEVYGLEETAFAAHGMPAPGVCVGSTAYPGKAPGLAQVGRLARHCDFDGPARLFGCGRCSDERRPHGGTVIVQRSLAS